MQKVTDRSPKAVQEWEVVMRGSVTIRVGDSMFLPYNVAVAAGEPSDWKKFHAKYADQPCTVVGIELRNWADSDSKPRNTATFKMRFADGAEQTINPESLIYLGPSKKK